MMDIVLRSGRERVLARRHPWLLSGAIDRVVAEAGGKGSPGAWARVVNRAGEPLAYGHYSPASSIRVRLLHFGKDDPGEALIEKRIAQAVARRAADPLLADTDAVRLVNSEGDGLPGLVADRFADAVVVKLTTAGMATRRDRIAQALQQASGAALGFERADGSAARREGFKARDGLLWGALPEAGETPLDAWPVREHGRRFQVDLRSGQKTGFYLDQRDARDLTAALARGRRVLDLFSYTGGFSVAAALGGASQLTLVDSSAGALERAETQLQDNAPDVPRTLVRADAFEQLRAFQAEGERFDLLLIDPPPLARSRHDVTRATRALKDLLLHGFRIAAPEALVMVFACSHHLDPELLHKVSAGAALDASRSVALLRTLTAPADHPVDLAHPEGRYLSGLLLRVSE